MILEDIQAVKALLDTPKQIVIIPHVNPDGDAVGSILGLAHYLKLKGQNPVVMVPNPFPEFLSWIPGATDIVVFDQDTDKASKTIQEADLIFTLDFNALQRTGEAEAALIASKAIKIMIDHHQAPDDYASYMYSDVSMSSTCEMVYNFIDMMGDVKIIDSNIATALYTGIMTDTGSFRFASTTSKTHQIVAHLIEAGANNAQIHNSVFDANAPSRLQLLGVALNSLTILKTYRTAFMYLSQKDLDNNDFKKGDTEGFVNYCLSLKGIVLAAIFIENSADNIIKISLRSKGDFSVNELSRAHFNGGGHTNAAGGRSSENLQETITRFKNILPQYKTLINE